MGTPYEKLDEASQVMDRLWDRLRAAAAEKPLEEREQWLQTIADLEQRFEAFSGGLLDALVSKLGHEMR